MDDSKSEQGIYMMKMDHLVVPESKDGLKKTKWWSYEKGMQKTSRKSFQWSKLEETEKPNKQCGTILHLKV